MEGDPQTKKDLIKGVFSRAAVTYDQVGPRFFSYFGQRLVELAQLPKGARVLDVAVGRGAVLFAAAEQVGPDGSVIGIDLAEPMVDQTAAEARRRGLANVEVRQMDAEQLAFPDSSFGAVLCGFALFFFPHLDLALSEFIRVLKPLGWVAASTWGKDDERWSWLQEINKAYQVQVKLSTTSLDKPAELKAVMARAGFADSTSSRRRRSLSRPTRRSGGRPVGPTEAFAGGSG